MTWHEAIQKVLSEENAPLHYQEITRLIFEKGYKNTEGATPEATVNAQITADIKHNFSSTNYIKVDKGTFTLKSKTEFSSTEDLVSDETIEEILEEELYESVIHSYGMFWSRDKVLWKSNPDIFGTSQSSTTLINFNKQIGIYLLYDGREIIYVGQAIKQPIGERLYQHTIDRLNGRWDRFSWFGLYSVKNNGELKIIDETNRAITIEDLGDTLEAVLIEAIEPRQNRKKGNSFSGIEYLQFEDPELLKKKKEQMLRELMGKI